MLLPPPVEGPKPQAQVTESYCMVYERPNYWFTNTDQKYTPYIWFSTRYIWTQKKCVTNWTQKKCVEKPMREKKILLKCQMWS